MPQTPDPDEPTQDETTPDTDPTEPAPKPLRPVDWDGSFTRTWNARDDHEVTNRQFAELAEKRDRESMDRLMQELLAETEANFRQNDGHPYPEANTGGPHKGAEPRQSLFDRMENFGRRTEDDSEEGDGSEGSADHR
ncbi:hypothetical protein [Frankia sp. AgB32]|uniref:hypothetical protein n=1 Tax=Frankia sp. AgB32 TaxID=631119 RepID=UPI00200E39FA|nr:hypothetical protein [Frankia sp. AgB32]MCK9897299.1 hypothetical protein [Frankia sp. AgB32]